MSVVVDPRAKGHHQAGHVTSRDGTIDIHDDNRSVYSPQKGEAFRHQHPGISEIPIGGQDVSGWGREEAGWVSWSSDHG